MSDDDTLRERVAVLEHSLQSLKEQMLLRAETHQRALDVQTAELARRLDGLNGEAERLRAMQATFVRRDLYDITVGDLGTLRATVGNMAGRMTTIAGLVGLAAGLLSSVVMRMIRP